MNYFSITRASPAERGELSFCLARRGGGAVGCLTHIFRLGLTSVSFTLNPALASDFAVLGTAAVVHHTDRFHALETESFSNHLSNAEAGLWLQQHIPRFECPEREVEATYYFRWWSFRKHLQPTPAGFVITEFLTPVKHAGAYNTISCAAGLHLAEGRWLRDGRYLDDYTRFWLRGDRGRPQPHFHQFSSWFAAAAWNRYLVNADRKFILGLLPDLVADYRAWETERRLTTGLFWQYDVADGMEESISGSRTAKNIRPTINSYMFANAQAIANIAQLAGKPKLTGEFTTKANDLKHLTQQHLWDTNANFFKVLIAPTTSSVASVPYVLSTAREAIGFIPWMFNLPEANPAHAAAFAQLTDPRGFSAPFGLTTAERRHPQFRSHGIGTCEWDGAVWPFATSQTLYGLANHLRQDSSRASVISSLSPPNGERAGVKGSLLSTNMLVSTGDYFAAFLTYTRSQQANGKPYIGEYLDEVTGAWINRNSRSAYYNHSTYADLLITGLVGLIPRADDLVEIDPLLPPGTWDWFCLDGVKYHGHPLTVIWDKDGARYGRGAGLRVLANGRTVAQSEKLERIIGKLP
jgi:hypothetical protein